MKRRGVIYCVHGRVKFLNEAIESAKSVRRKSPTLEICLFHTYSDTELESRDISVFDDIKKIIFPKLPSNFSGNMKGFAGKLCSFGETPYDYTLFMDSDTIVHKPIDNMFDLLEKFDIAVAPGPMTQKPVNDSDIINEIPDTFPELNTGIILYRKTPKMLNFLEKWKQTFLYNKRGLYRRHGKGGEQVSLRFLLWESEDIRMYILSSKGMPNLYNYRWKLDRVPFNFKNRVVIHHHNRAQD